MKKAIFLITSLSLFLCASAYASPILCAKAISKAGKDVISIAQNEYTTFKKQCEALLACKKECRDVRKLLKKELKSFYKGCKKECKKAYKESSKDKSKKKAAKAEKKKCQSLCKGLNKEGKAFIKDSKLNKCGGKCRPEKSDGCKKAQRALALKILAKAPVHAVKIGAACAAPTP